MLTLTHNPNLNGDLNSKPNDEPHSNPMQGYSSMPESHRKLKVSRTVWDEVRQERAAIVREGQQRLTLVLDLDHTLLNSTQMYVNGVPDMDPETIRKLEAIHMAAGNAGANKNGEGVGLLRRLDHINMWTKLRPYVNEFLQEASKLYQLYIYTMGERGYADEMRLLLDPTCELFGDPKKEGCRMIAREDCTTSKV